MPDTAPRGWSAPDHLHGCARREWDFIVKNLQATGVLTVVDRDVLATYCSLFAWQLECELMIRRQGRVKRTPNGHEATSPWVTQFRAAVLLKKAYLLELGLTPAARARMGSSMADPPPAPKDDEPDSETPQAGDFTDLIGRRH